MMQRIPYGQRFWDRLDQFPPILCRLLARVPRGRPLATAEIADRSGLSFIQVENISQQSDWRGVDLPTARAWMQACGTDLSNRSHVRRIRAYLRSLPRDYSRWFPYLRADAKQWKQYYLPLLERWVRSRK